MGNNSGNKWLLRTDFCCGRFQSASVVVQTRNTVFGKGKQKISAVKSFDSTADMAQMVGVEPTRQSPVLKHFECSLLRPLEYICLFNFVARNFPQGAISSATPSTSWVMLLIVIPQNLLRKKERKVGENSKYLIVENSGFFDDESLENQW